MIEFRDVRKYVERCTEACVYQTSDKKLFISERESREWQMDLDTLKWLMENIPEDMVNHTNAVFKFMKDNWNDIITLVKTQAKIEGK